MIIQPVILSGGSGTRLWPLSREYYPKQLLPLVTEYSLLQDTVLRLDGLNKVILSNKETITVNSPIVVCNEEHRFLIAEQLRQIEKDALSIILEPIGRNTAPALTLAALYADKYAEEDQEKASQDRLLLVMPADHVISNVSSFHESVCKAGLCAAQNALVTFGIVPNTPETGYGYIEIDKPHKDSDLSVQGIKSFIEKPDLETAEKYLETGRYLWNSGMFMMRCSSWLKAMELFSPEILETCKTAFNSGQDDLDFYRVNKQQFEKCISDSIDYAVMEKLSTTPDLEAFVVPLDADWSDVGAWSSLWEVSDQDEQGNAIKGDVFAFESRNNLINASNRLVTTVGVDNHIIVETADAVMVAHKDNSQDVKQIVNWLKESGRTENQLHQQVFRPWGSYEGVVSGERFQVKRIIVNPEASLSLQMHHHRAEHWIVVKGTARVTRGDDVFLLSENESTYIPIGVTHRLENPGMVSLEIIEVQSGSYLGEDDIVRFEDVYGRKD